MAANEKTITLFTTRARQMILQFKQMKKENEELYSMVDERDARIRQLEETVKQWQRDYNSLKMAKMLEVTDDDLDGAKKRVASLIRDINKCITLLSGRDD